MFTIGEGDFNVEAEFSFSKIDLISMRNKVFFSKLKRGTQQIG
jgi:hypothetical protein